MNADTPTRRPGGAPRPSRAHRGRAVRPVAAIAALLALAGLPATSAAAAQEPVVPPRETLPAVEGRLTPAASSDSLRLVDRVVAVVGDTAILMSELQEEVIRLRTQAPDVPEQGTPEFEAFVRQLLANLVDQAILLQHAKRDPQLAASDEQLSQLVEERFRQVRANFSSDEEMQQAVEQAGMNMFQYRQMLRAQARSEVLLDNYRRQLQQSGRLPGATVNEAEVREYFERRASGETRPATVSFGRLVVDPEPSAAADSAALEVARTAFEELYEQGEEFEVVARRYSEDEGTRAQGGDLGWLRRGDVVPAFGDAAWSAPLGRAVGPVRTRFGYHIIKVENVRAGERKLRHILIQPEISEEDIAAARERAEALADSLREGADAARLAERQDLPESDQVVFEDIEMSQLANRFGQRYREELGIPLPGDVVGPFRTQGPSGAPAFVVLEVTEYRPEGPYELDDVRDRIRTSLMQQKQFQRFLEQLRDETFVKVLL